MEYRVTWRVEVDADSPREAAERALAMQRDPASTATNFRVTEWVPDGATCTVDLQEER